jgi:hypothetical protein
MRPSLRFRAPLVGAALAAPLSLAIGCASPTEPPAPVGGGAEYVLDYDAFAANVLPVLQSAGCRSTECHGGGIRGTYQLSSPDDVDSRFDFDQTVLQVRPHELEESPILTQPLAVAAGGELHPYEPFESRDDPGYVALSAWVLSGETR